MFLCSVFLVFLIWAKLPEINKWMDGWIVFCSVWRSSSSNDGGGGGGVELFVNQCLFVGTSVLMKS